ncbi:MAG: cupredoxin domain-containing protein [Acidimicrobiia bacterium]
MTDQMTTQVTNRPAARKMPTQAFGIALITGSLAVFLVGTLLFMSAGDAVSAAVLTAVAGLVAWVTWRFDKLWAVLLGLVATVLATLGMFYVAFGVLQPFSPFEFIAGLLFLFGVVFALVGGIGRLRRRNRESGSGRKSLVARRVVLVILGVGTVFSIGGFLTTRATVSAVDAAGALTVDMANFEFDPSAPSAMSGQKLLLTNSDAFVHDFTLDQYDIHVTVGPGSEAIVDLSELPPGKYQFYCSLHSEGIDGMAGTISVEG